MNDSNPTLLLAAHGSRVDASVNATIRHTARAVGRPQEFQSVIAAFHHGRPGYAEALSSTTTREIVVVPMMTSNGYYTNLVLREAIDAGRQSNSDVSVSMTPPVGTHPAVARIVAGRIETLIRHFQLCKNKVTVLLIGHGTRRHSTSRDATTDLAQRIRLMNYGFSELKTAFIDDDPEIPYVVQSIENAQIIVIPFLISCGIHARIDIARSIGLPGIEDAQPTLFEKGDTRYVIDQAFGTWREIESLVRSRAMERRINRNEYAPLPNSLFMDAAGGPR